MDEGLEFVWSLVAGILYCISGIALLGALILGIDQVLNAEWLGEGNDVRLRYTINCFVCAVVSFGITRLGWYFVDCARQRERDP